MIWRRFVQTSDYLIFMYALWRVIGIDRAVDSLSSYWVVFVPETLYFLLPPRGGRLYFLLPPRGGRGVLIG